MSEDLETKADRAYVEARLVGRGIWRAEEVRAAVVEELRREEPSVERLAKAAEVEVVTAARWLSG